MKQNRFGKFFKDLIIDIKNNPIPFIISFLLSIMLFYYIANISVQSLLMVGDLQYRMSSKDLYIIDKKPVKVRVTLRGAEDNLKLVNEDLIRPYIKIDADKPGYYTYKISLDESYLPSNIKVSKIEPSNIKIQIDKIIRKKIDLEPNVTGTPANGYITGSIKFTNNSAVIVEGPYSVLSNIEKLKTKEVSIDGLNFPYVTKVELENEDIKIVSPASIQIIIDIRPASLEKEITNIPILLANKNEKFDYKLSVPMFNATVFIPFNTNLNISSSDLVFIIDCSYFHSTGIYVIKIIPKIYDNLFISIIKPEFVQLEITEAKSYEEDDNEKNK
jgi:YbbR domain-containing protein